MRQAPEKATSTMTIQSDESDGDDSFNAEPWCSGDGRSLDHLLRFVAPGSRLFFDFQPMARIEGQLGFLEMAPCVGIVRSTHRHESIIGMHFHHGDKKCLLTFDELNALVKLLEFWITGAKHSPNDSPSVKSVRFETRGGLVLESSESVWGEAACIRVASPVTFLLSVSQLENLLRECRRVQAFLEQFRP